MSTEPPSREAPLAALAAYSILGDEAAGGPGVPGAGLLDPGSEGLASSRTRTPASSRASSHGVDMSRVGTKEPAPEGQAAGANRASAELGAMATKQTLVTLMIEVQTAGTRGHRFLFGAGSAELSSTRGDHVANSDWEGAECNTTLRLRKADMVYVDKVERGWALAYKQDERRRRLENQWGWVPQARLFRRSYYVACDWSADEATGYVQMSCGDRAVIFVQHNDHWVYGARLPQVVDGKIVQGWFPLSTVLPEVTDELAAMPACSPLGGRRPEWDWTEWARVPRDRDAAGAGAVGHEPYPLSDIRWTPLPDGPQPALCIAHCCADPSWVFSNAHNEVAWCARQCARAWGHSDEYRSGQSEMARQVSAVKQAFAGSSWRSAHVASAWAALHPHGQLIRAFGVGFKWQHRIRAAKAALAIAIHVILGEERTGPLWWLQPLADQCMRARDVACELVEPDVRRS